MSWMLQDSKVLTLRSHKKYTIFKKTVISWKVIVATNNMTYLNNTKMLGEVGAKFAWEEVVAVNIYSDIVLKCEYGCGNGTSPDESMSLIHNCGQLHQCGLWLSQEPNIGRQKKENGSHLCRVMRNWPWKSNDKCIYESGRICSF